MQRSRSLASLALLASCGGEQGPGSPDCERCAVADAQQLPGGQDGLLLFDTADFPPRWNCGTWSDPHGWVHVFADAATWLSYMAIPVMLLLLIRRRDDIPFPRLLWLFGLFIVCCGFTHLLEAAMFWWPAYRFMGLVKVVTAVVSMTTAVVLVFELPKFFQMRSPHQLEREVARRTAELEAARAEAQRSAAARARFTANVSHELRTPLGAIVGFAELLEDGGGLDGVQRERLAVIRRSGAHLVSVINDVLDLSRSDAGQLSIVPEPTELAALVDDVVGMFTIQAARKGIELKARVATGGAPVMADAKRLRQILINLIGNAVKFTERGCVEVIAGITPTAQPDVGRWCVDVRDSGIGMTSEQAESVFDEYAQADDSMVRRFGGSGLGLTISRRLARAMAGDLVVADCAIGSGTTMRLTVELPFAVGATPAPAEANGPPPRLDGCRVLVVDDAADNRALMDGVLTTSGALVQCVEDGLQAVELLTAPDAAAFDLILMDLQMPRMDGLEATRRLRASGVTAPIVALTASTCEEHRVASIAAGCDGHLGKPIQGRALLRAIHDVLARGCVGAAPASR